MCFSANASFGAATALLVVGALALKNVHKPTQIPFAAIPLLFSVQQFVEGVLWLSLTHSAYAAWESSAAVLFLVFAYVLWPAWVPLSITLLEKDRKRKNFLWMLTCMGVVLAGYMAYCLKAYTVTAEIAMYHIQYTLHFPLSLAWTGTVFYFIPTVLPPFVSSNKPVSIFGIAIAAAYLFTKIVFPDSVISVWCFFAAIISVVVLYIVSKLNAPVAIGKKYPLPHN